MLTSLPVTEPIGTYLSRVHNGSMQLPPAIAEYCQAAGWSLFRFLITDKDHVTIRPVLPAEPGKFMPRSMPTAGFGSPPNCAGKSILRSRVSCSGWNPAVSICISAKSSRR